MVLEALGAAAVGSLVDQAVERVLGRVAVDSGRPKPDSTEARTALLHHLKKVDTWSREIAFRDLLKAKDLQASFVELNLRLGIEQANDRIDATSVGVTDLFRASDHTVILGRPGAGKTTTLQRFAQMALADWNAGAARVPVVVLLREIRPHTSLVSLLLGTLGIHVRNVLPSGELRDPAPWLARILAEYLDQISALLLLDGLDEVHPDAREALDLQIEDLMLHASTARVVVTCRKAAYDKALRNCAVYTVRPLTKDQVQVFAERWLGAERSAGFLDSLHQSPYAGTEVLPLTLAHLCAIFERRGEIPRKPTEVYEKIVFLLLEEWDAQRQIRRPSSYAEFAISQKARFLRAIAFELTMLGARVAFHHHDLQRAYLKVCNEFGLPEHDAERVAREIESHSGLVLQAGRDQYEFAHKVIQEYLTGSYLVGTLWAIAVAIPALPDELAIATALSSRPDEYLEEILRRVIGTGEGGGYFLFRFVNRLQVERPDMRPSARLGWVLLAMFELMCFEGNVARTAVARARVYREWARLLSDARARESVVLAYREGRSEPDQGLVLITPASSRQVPAVVEEIQRRFASSGFAIPSDLIVGMREGGAAV